MIPTRDRWRRNAGEEGTPDEICREGAERMLGATLELEAGEYIAAVEHLLGDEDGGW